VAAVSAQWYPHMQWQADSADVAAAKAQHAAAYVEQAQRIGAAIPAAYLLAANPVQDTAEVQQAKLEHFRAHAEAALRG